MTQENITPRTFAQAMQEIEQTLRAQLLDMPENDSSLQDRQIKRLRERLEECSMLLDAIDTAAALPASENALKWRVVDGHFVINTTYPDEYQMKWDCETPEKAQAKAYRLNDDEQAEFASVIAAHKQNAAARSAAADTVAGSGNSGTGGEA